MAYPYDEVYLEPVQKNLGFFFQMALRNLKLAPEIVQDAFLTSQIPEQIEMGNPDFLCGKSGYELALIAFPQVKKPLANHSTPKQNIGAEQSSPIFNGRRASPFLKFSRATRLNAFFPITT